MYNKNDNDSEIYYCHDLKISGVTFLKNCQRFQEQPTRFQALQTPVKLALARTWEWWHLFPPFLIYCCILKNVLSR